MSERASQLRVHEELHNEKETETDRGGVMLDRKMMRERKREIMREDE